MDNFSIGDAGITALFGYAVVFVGLLILMCVLYAMGAVFRHRNAKQRAAVPVNRSMPEQAQEKAPAAPEKPLAPGSAGRVKRFDVPDKEAAMIMAVTAYQLGVPLNELRFISIREVTDDEI